MCSGVHFNKHFLGSTLDALNIERSENGLVTTLLYMG